MSLYSDQRYYDYGWLRPTPSPRRYYPPTVPARTKSNVERAKDVLIGIAENPSIDAGIRIQAASRLLP